MPKFARPGYSRIELFIPDDLFGALESAATLKSESITVAICRALAAQLKVSYEPPPMGRRKPPPQKPASKRK